MSKKATTPNLMKKTKERVLPRKKKASLMCKLFKRDFFQSTDRILGLITE